MARHGIAVGNIRKPLGKVGAVKMQPRKIAGNRMQRKVARLPATQVAADLLKYKKINGRHKAVAFKHGDKTARQQHSP